MKAALHIFFFLSGAINRGDDSTLAMIQNRFINMFENVFNTEIDDSRKELYDWAREETKELREKDIESRREEAFNLDKDLTR